MLVPGWKEQDVEVGRDFGIEEEVISTGLQDVG